LLSNEEVELWDWLHDNGGIGFEDHVKAYVDSKSHAKRMECLKDTRLTRFYELLVDVGLRLYHAAQAHSKLLTRMDNLTIPKAYEHCETLQQYVEEVASSEQSRKVGLRHSLKRAQQLVAHAKRAAQQKTLDEEVLRILVSKIRSLQEHYRDAAAALGDSSHDLIDEAQDIWW
jgi:hypothetical protein